MESVKPEEIANFCESFSQVPMHIPYQLRTLLSSVKSIDSTSTLKEVLEALKDYIYFNELYDKRDPNIIHCENDSLKDVFGVTQFSLYEINRIVLRLLMSENRQNISNLLAQAASAVAESNKRKAEDDDDDAAESKKMCTEHVLPAHEPSSTVSGSQTSVIVNVADDSSSLSSDHDEDNTDNKFSQLTQFGVSLFNRIFGVGPPFAVEYDVESDSSAIGSVTDTESEAEDIVGVATVKKVIKVDSDMEFWADDSSEDVNEDSDVEIPESDKWECKTCGSRNKPVVRYCEKCFYERKGWADGRKEHRIPPRSKKRKEPKRSCRDEQADCVASSEAGSSSQSVPPIGKCIICCDKPKNATVIHGKIGHQFSCYRCARKLSSLNKPCPICRKPIERVVHQIVG